jgi:hypothetical protein
MRHLSCALIVSLAAASLYAQGRGGPLRFLRQLKKRRQSILSVTGSPQYLEEPFVTSTDFKKQPDLSGWAPSVCTSK